MESDILDNAFFANLNRNNKAIKRDRAIAITEDAEMHYKREVEDLEMTIKRVQRERASMLDLAPTTADSLIVASDFDARKFIQKDIELGIKLRNLQITLDVAKSRYKELFNPVVDGTGEALK